MISVYCDGLCKPYNPGGVAAYGFVIYEGKKKLSEGKGVIGQGKGMTNNVAEYTAAIEAMSWLLGHEYQGKKVTLASDSMLLVKQLSSSWRVRSERIRPLHRRASELARRLRVRFHWVPREENEEADGLSVHAYVEYEEAKRRARIKGVLPRLEKLETGKYLVHGSQTTYLVDLDAGDCTCPDFEKRHSERFPIRCKHILAALEAEEATNRKSLPLGRSRLSPVQKEEEKP